MARGAPAETLLEDMTPEELLRAARQLEGLLASTTRRLEERERELAEMQDELDGGGLSGPAPLALHLSRIDQAMTRLASVLCDDVTEDADELWTPDGDLPESRVEVISDAILTLANARDRLTPKGAHRGA